MSDLHGLLPKSQTNFLTRGYVLFTSLMGFSAALCYFVPRFPFHRNLCLVALVSGILHMLLYLFFKRVSLRLWKAANLLNSVLLGFVLHYSGGILSPFSIFLVLIFISGAGYGMIESPIALFSVTITFLVVALGEYFQILIPLAIKPQDIYSSGFFFAVLIVMTVVGYIYTCSIYKIVVSWLQRMLDEEQAKINSMREKLSQLEAPSQLGRLVAKITHDIRGPLCSFRSLFELLVASPELSEENRDDCRLMMREVDQVSEMLGHMQKYLRPGESRRGKVRLAEILDTILSVSRFHPNARSIRFICDYNGLMQVQVWGNKEEMQQVCFNIVKNSIDALDGIAREKTVHVELARQGETAVLRFRDNGRGIPKHLLAWLNQRSSLTTKPDGNGLGLLIVREILGNYGGDMAIDSIEGNGTEVVLRLPIHEDARIPAAGSP